MVCNQCIQSIADKDCELEWFEKQMRDDITSQIIDGDELNLLMFMFLLFIFTHGQKYEVSIEDRTHSSRNSL